jgi:spore maturation protein CgeB
LRIVMFYHSLESDWNHGNAHFLRGVVAELIRRGHEVEVWETADGWSRRHLPEGALEEFRVFYPGLESRKYAVESLDLDDAFRNADLVIVHEWTDPRLVARIGCHRRSHDYLLLYHDTHHRAVTKPAEIAAFDLSGYDGALVFGESLRRRYAEIHPRLRAWVWHEAADTSRFRPVNGWGAIGQPLPYGRGSVESCASESTRWDLVWIGNWGDSERSEELREFLLEPVKALRLKARVHGVRYPEDALVALEASGIEYGGWLANYLAPDLFAQARMTVHVPRRPYAEALPGIPTIRMFEALACGIALISAPWEDSEGLFEAGRDYLAARSGEEMKHQMQALLSDDGLRAEVAGHGLRTILRRHTCAHRVNELLEMVGA